MKKRISLFLAIILALGLLTACANRGVETADGLYSEAPQANYAVNADMSVKSAAKGGFAPGADAYDGAMEAEPMPSPAEKGDKGSDGTFTTTSNTVEDMAEKMIYSANATVETTDFDKSVKAVYEMIDNYGGFIESSYVTGQDYTSQWNNNIPRRTASFVIRVPQAGFASMTENLSVVGNVTSVRRYAENITEQFYDSKARLDTYRIEQDRLLAMLEKADNVNDMIQLESRLSEVRYNIESIESRLRNWQKQVDYSSVTLNLTEVKQLTNIVEPKRSYWKEMWDGFLWTLEDIGDFFKDLFMEFVINLPVFILFAIVIIVIVLVIRLIIRRHKKKKEAKALARAQQAEESK